jgi:DNA-binding HxlR family transcriptional regulator
MGRLDVREVRAGSRVLSILENPLNTRVLRAHADGPKRLAELQQKVGWSASTTLRAAVSYLCELGALIKQKVCDSPYAVATALSPLGDEMLLVADEVEVWLARCPEGPIAPDGEAARVAVKALAGGWNSTLMRALSKGSFGLVELSRIIPEVSYPTLERRVSWMRSTGQIEPVETGGRSTPYVVTRWLRQAVAPICVGGRCERRHMGDVSPRATSVEVETALLLAVPLVPLRNEAAGSCVLGVQIESGDAATDTPTLAGVTVEVIGGELLDCVPTLDAAPRTWAIGPSIAWLDAVIDGNIEDLRIGGADAQLALDLVAGIHCALFTDR